MTRREDFAELSRVRAELAVVEASVRQHDADIARLSELQRRLRRENRIDEATAAADELEERERARREQMRRLAELRARAGEIFEELTVTDDPAEQLGELDAGQVIALLPVRLETHFRPTDGGTELLVRIYPDDVHVEVHEPELTDDEVDAGAAFWLETIDAATRPDDEQEPARLAAWRQLAVRLGRERAAWVAQAMQPQTPSDGEPVFPDTPRHVEEWTRAPQARTLPDRWVILGYSGGSRVIEAWGRPIPDPLPVGPDPDAEVPEPTDGLPAVDPSVRWMFDFAEAETVGMGVRIALGDDTPPTIDLLIALGVKASVGAEESAERMTALLDGHHYAAGLEFLRQGTPTNNTGDRRSGANRPDPTFERSFAVERGDPLVESGDGSNGDLTAVALGIDPGVFAHVAGAELDEQGEAQCMNAALWHATWGYFLGQVMAPTFSRSQILAFRRHFVEHVRGRGPLPVMRVGDQPYGVLPVTSLDDFTLDGGSADARDAITRLIQLRDRFWRPAIDRVPRVGSGDDPDATLLGIISMDSASRDYAARRSFGGHYFRNWWHWRSIDGFDEFEIARRALSRTALDQLAVDWEPRAADFVYLPWVFELNGPRVEPGPLSLSEPLDPNYISWLRTATPEEIRAESIDGEPPNSLLYLVLRHAALMAYGTTAFELISRFSADIAALHVESEMLDFGDDEEPTPTLSNVLDQSLPALTGAGTLAGFLHEAHTLEFPELIDYSEFWEALECLEGLPTESLDLLFRETLDLCSHRLDAWITSLAVLALKRARTAAPQGLHLGGFGWVEDLWPGATRRSEGYVHAPSLEHATTAAVLRSGYLARDQGDGDSPLAVDLSSARTRLAMSVLDAVRQGQPLGAVLGYRFERGLHENHPDRELDKYILPFRELEPLVARKLRPTDAPVEKIAAHNVVDGLALHRRFKADDIPWGQRGLPAVGSGDDAAVLAELHELDLVVDSVSDAVTAESVFQAIRGNPTRSGAVLDAIGRGEAPPPHLEVARTARTGVGLTHRILIGFDEQVTTPSDWPTDARQARGQAAPRVNAWLADLLGSPNRVRCRVEYLDATTEALLASAELVLGSLRLSPLDALHIVTVDQGEGSELERRLALHAMTEAPAAVPGDAIVRLVFARDPAWATDVIDIPAFGELIRPIRELLAEARNLVPSDLAAPGERVDDLVDSSELRGRADSAVTAYRDVADTLDALADPAAPLPNSGDLREQLLRAAHFGVPGAIPLALRDSDADAQSTLTAQATSIAREMRRRLAAIDAADLAFDRPTASAATQLEHDTARLHRVFGPGFAVVPLFTPANPGELTQAFASSDDLQAGDPHEVVGWLKTVARVRPRAATFAEAHLNADAIAGTDPLRLTVAQLPFQPGDRWAALEDEGQSRDANRLSLVAQLGEGLEFSRKVAGVIVDEWVETVPSTTETTAVAFHYDQPNSRAPNAVLLAVPPDPSRSWDLDTLEKILLETIELAKMRAVDTEALTGLGHLLPALYFATNPQGKTVSTDFARNRTGA